MICSGESTTQVKAITEHIETEFMKNSVKPLSVEGLRYAHWILMDYGDVIVHIFEAQTRAYYELEKLWLDAPRISTASEEHAHSLRKRESPRGERLLL